MPCCATPVTSLDDAAAAGGPPPGVRRGRRFKANDSGAAAVEFALVALPFLAIIYSIIEVGVDFLIYTQIDYALVKASQDVRSGTVQLQNMGAATFKTDVVCPKLSGLTCASVLLNVAKVQDKYYAEAWRSGTITSSTQRWCPGGSGDTIALQIAYPVPLASMIWAGAYSTAANTRYYLSSTVVRNDPFGMAASSAAC